MWCSPLNEVEQLQAQWGCSKSQHSSGFSPLSAVLDLLTSSPEIPCWDWGSTGGPLPSLLAADWDCCHGFWCVVNTSKHNSCVPIPVLSLAALSCGTLRAFPSGQAVYFRWIPLLFLPAGLLGLLENENINFQSSRGLLLSDIRALKISFLSLCFGRFGCKWRKSETGIFYWDGSSNFTCPAPAGRWCWDIWGSPGQFRINPIIPTWKDCGDYLIRKIHEEQLLLGETKGNWRNTSIFQTQVVQVQNPNSQMQHSNAFPAMEFQPGKTLVQILICILDDGTENSGNALPSGGNLDFSCVLLLLLSAWKSNRDGSRDGTKLWD